MPGGLDVLLATPVAKASGLGVLMGGDVPNAPAPQPAEPTPWEKYGGELGRQVGLTVRHGINGLTGIPQMMGNGLNSIVNLGIQGVNAATDSNIQQLPMVSETIGKGLDAAGLPQPKNAEERIVGDAASAMAGTGGTYKLGMQLLKSDPLSATGQALTSVPGNQVLAGAGAGAGAGAARELGLGPAWQLGGSLLGGIGGALGASALGSGFNASTKLLPQSWQARMNGETSPAAAAPAVESVTSNSPLPPSKEQVDALSSRTASIISSNPTADPMAAARSAEFRSLGMTGETGPTIGQVTRNPGQYAQEQNWRGTPSGQPLLRRFNNQNQALAQALDATAASGGTEYQAGKTIISALKDFDTSLRTKVTAAYQQARASAGKDMDVPLQGVAQDYAAVLHNYGDAVPSGVRNNFDSLGLTSGTQKKVFTIEDAENLLKVINRNQSNDPATANALKELTQSVKKAVLSADDQGGVFAGARKLAAERFDLWDKVPALKAAVNDSVPADNFAKRFVINGNVDDLSGLVSSLKGNDGALGAVRGQIGSRLREAAFGQNLAGDKAFAPERYAQALNKQLGQDLLSKVYSPEQIDSLNTIGRVGSYINSEPAFSPVNRSNTGSALIDMLNDVPVIGKVTNSLGKRAMIARALGGDLANTKQIPADQGKALGSAILMQGAQARNKP